MKKMTEKEFTEACNGYGQSWSNCFMVKWCTGGTSGSCWGPELMSVSPDAPEELTSLDDFLSDYFPEITFMQYKKISNAVSTDTASEGDYYGGTTHSVKKIMYYSTLQELLVNMNLLEITYQ